MQICQRGEQTDNLFDLRFGGIPTDSPVATYTNSITPDGRLDRERISNAMLRISDLSLHGATIGEHVQIHVFMNMPTATEATPLDEERHVATFRFEWRGKPETHMQNITYKTQTVVGDGDVIITLVTERPDLMFSCAGVFMAIYAKA